MKLLASALFLAVLQFSPAHSEASVTPADCDTIETDAGVALDLVNRHRRDGYVFGLFRVVDAYKQDVGNSSVLYLTLDVLETECSVLSGRPWASCEYSNAYSQVFGQCKIVTYTSQWMKNKQHLYGFNCTVSPVPPDLLECEDCPVKVEVLEVTAQHKDVAAKALEKYNSESNHTSHFNVDKVEKILKMTGSREGHVVEFSIKETNCSKRAAQHTDTQLECDFLDGWRAQKGFCKATINVPEEREGTDITCELYHPWQHHCGQKCSSPPPCRPHKHPHHRGGHGHRHRHRHPPHFASKDSEHHHNFSEEHQDSHEGHPPPPPHGGPHHHHPPHHHCPPPPPQEEAHDPASPLLKDESHPPPPHPPQNETHYFPHPPHHRPPHPPPHHDGPHHFPHPPHHGPLCPHPPPHHDGPDHPPHPPHHGPPCPHHPHHHGPPHPPHPPHHGPHCPPPHHHGPPHPHHPPHHRPHCPPPPPPGHPRYHHHHYHRHPYNKTSLSGKHFPFQQGAVYRIPVLNQQDTLTLPLSNFLSQSDPHFSDTAEGSHFTGSGQEKTSGIHDFPHHPSQSKSCPGKPKRQLPHILLLLSQESAAKTSPK
ncbi:histidine-rich glycoprotein-like isoform X2 [Nothoprocta perdicaria]|uniref:histidine-rich glycoprotein-like isoform X2 n=1 Tax=Nothoprocta perdicaria TaxID=30464 RepID=UPI000E1BA94D|nr:histidine-rich glycoprotein-like isoform X2 [Nothoprocta perdicaria]